MPADLSGDAPVFTAADQRDREAAYDEALEAIEREARRAAGAHADRLAMQDRVMESFGRFAATALDLEPEAVQLLTGGFIPIGREFGQRARRFDAALTHAEILQACRNAWTVCGLQPLLGDAMALTPSIVGYSLLYPYSDNYLDAARASRDEKLRFSARFLARLRGDVLEPLNRREQAIWNLVEMIEMQYPRDEYPQAFDCLIAIHRAQEQSMAQLRAAGECDLRQVLEISCAKGGSSVLADACLCHGWLDQDESEFAFDWGVLLQLGDDLQDVREDLRSGAQTLFSRAAAAGAPLDAPTARLLNLSGRLSARMDRLPHGSRELKALLRMSWRSLIVMAVAQTEEYFTPAFAAEIERRSPFRFAFLRARQKRVARRRGLYANLFEIFLAPQSADRAASLSGAALAATVHL